MKTQCPFDIELHREIWEQGYRAAEKDNELTWEEAKKIVAAFFYVVETELIGPVLLEDEELYGKVLKRFKEKRNV